MRITFYSPEGELTPDLVSDVLTLVTYYPKHKISFWTPNEMLIAYDWAIREHLSASGNPVRRRPRPYFLSQFEETE